MSRIGRKPILLLEGVKIEIAEQKIKISGPKGELSWQCHPKIKVVKEDNQILIQRQGNDKLACSLHGLTRRLIANMIEGVTNGFEKKLELKGVGYRATVQGEKLVLAVGFSHPLEIEAPQGISFQVQKNIITVSGIDKQLVGQVAAEIRSKRKPEPYKGKGIRYLDEIVRRKPGKAAKTTIAGV